jgi:23S rRNA pseudouridine1911/1915/1917 synthase
VRKGKPYIPPGAPGHPRTSSDPQAGRALKGRKPRADSRPPEEEPQRAARTTRKARAKAGKAVLVHEDEDILAYDKPAGLPVIAADGSRSRSLLDIASEQVRRHNPKGRAAVVHRIDRDTSGIVVFATKAKVKKELMGGWDELVSERRYVALVEGSMGGASGSYDSWLKENKAGQVFRAGIGERGAKRAITHWRLLGEGAGLSLLELTLGTGRKHQIRVQLSDAGHALIGDQRYGSLRDDLGRLCLHAVSIELTMPGRETLRIESPPPSEFAAALKKAPALNGRNASASASASRIAARKDAPPRRGGHREK